MPKKIKGKTKCIKCGEVIDDEIYYVDMWGAGLVAHCGKCIKEHELEEEIHSNIKVRKTYG